MSSVGDQFSQWVRRAQNTRLAGLLSLGRREWPGWTAIDQSRGCWGVSVAPPSNADGKPRVLACAGTETDTTDLDALRPILGAVSTAGFGLVGVLPPEAYQLALIERPAVNDDEMALSLQLLLEPRLDYPADEANVDWFEIPAHESQGNKPRQIYAVAARRALMDERTALIEGAGLPLTALDIRETARRNLGALIESHTGNGVVLVVADPTGLQITVTFGGELYLERLIPEKVLESWPTADTDARDRQADRIALEIQRSLDFLRRNFPFITVGDIQLGPLPEEIALQAALAGRLGEPVVTLDLAAHFEWTEAAGEILARPEAQAHYLTALGAALRFSDRSRA